jgi:hypothetical protein
MSQFVSNKDVSPIAAIEGTKIVPDFGSQNVFTDGYVALGPVPASIGQLRLENNVKIAFRNSSFIDDVVGLFVDSSDIVRIGEGSSGVTLYVGASVALPLTTESATTLASAQDGYALMVAGGGTRLEYGFVGLAPGGENQVLWSDGVTNTWTDSPTISNVYFASTAVNPRIEHLQPITDSPVSDLLIIGQSAAAGAVTYPDGGNVIINSGAGSSGSDGYVAINSGTDTLLELVELLPGQRVVAINRGVSLTTTEMGYNTGDLVMFVGDANTIPLDNPYSGFIMYSNDGVPEFRDPDGYVYSFRGLVTGGANQVFWSDGAANQWTGDPKVTSLSLGSAPATTGALRLSAGDYVYAYDGGADRIIIDLSGIGIGSIRFGSTSFGYTSVNSSGGVYLQGLAVNMRTAAGGEALSFNTNTGAFTFTNTTLAYVISQTTLTSGAANTLRVQAQASSSGAGGSLELWAGSGTTTNGYVRFGYGGTTVAQFSGYQSYGRVGAVNIFDSNGSLTTFGSTSSTVTYAGSTVSIGGSTSTRIADYSGAIAYKTFSTAVGASGAWTETLLGTLASVTFTQANAAASAHGATFTIQSQSAITANYNGGNLDLKSGASGGGGGTDGLVRFYSGVSLAGEFDQLGRLRIGYAAASDTGTIWGGVWPTTDMAFFIHDNRNAFSRGMFAATGGTGTMAQWNVVTNEGVGLGLNAVSSGGPVTAWRGWAGLMAAGNGLKIAITDTGASVLTDVAEITTTYLDLRPGASRALWLTATTASSYASASDGYALTKDATNGATWALLSAETAMAPGTINTVLWSDGVTNSWSGDPTVTSLTATASLAAGTTLDANVAGLFQSADDTSGKYSLRARNASGYSGLYVQGDGLVAFGGGATANAVWTAYETGGQGVIVANATGGSVIRSAIGGLIIRSSATGTSLYLDAPTTGGRVAIRTTAGYTVGLDLGATAADFLALGADPADSGTIRFSAGATIKGEASPTGTDATILTYTDQTALEIGSTGIDTTTITGGTVEINGASSTMIEAVEFTTQRIVSVLLGSNLTTTEMPANTGDRVMFVSNCAIPPSANPSGGVVHYIESGMPKWRDPSGNIYTLSGLSVGGANQVFWSNGSVNSWTGDPSVSNLFASDAVISGSNLDYGADAGAVVSVSLSGSGIGGVVSGRHSTDANGASRWALKSRGTQSSPTIVADADVISWFGVMAYDGNSYHIAASETYRVYDATPADGDIGMTFAMSMDHGGGWGSAQVVSVSPTGLTGGQFLWDFGYSDLYTAGHVGVGTSPDANVAGLFQAADDTSGKYSLYARNASGYLGLYVRGDGAVVFGGGASTAAVFEAYESGGYAYIDTARRTLIRASSGSLLLQATGASQSVVLDAPTAGGSILFRIGASYTAIQTVDAAGVTVSNNLGIRTSIDANVSLYTVAPDSTSSTRSLRATNSGSYVHLDVYGHGYVDFAGDATTSAVFRARYDSGNTLGIIEMIKASTHAYWINSQGNVGLQAAGASGVAHIIASGTNGIVRAQIGASYTTKLELGATASDFIALGTSPASAGAVRLTYQGSVEIDNGSGSSMVALINVQDGNGDKQIQVGSSSYLTNITGSNIYIGTLPGSLGLGSGSAGTILVCNGTGPGSQPTGGFQLWSVSGIPAWLTSAGDGVAWNMTSSTSASAGTYAFPDSVVEFMTITYNGNTRKIPLFAA